MLISSLLALPLLAQSIEGTGDPLQPIAEKIVASTDLHERVELARFARKKDTGGSFWWYMTEIQARQQVYDHAAGIRLATDALENPLEPGDQAMLHHLRASSFDYYNDPDRALADLLLAAKLDPGASEFSQAMHKRLATHIQAQAKRRDRREIDELAGKFPGDLSIILRQARATAAVSDKQQAKSLFRRVLEADPTLLTAEDCLNAAELCESLDDINGALGFLNWAQGQVDGEPFAERIQWLEDWASTLGDEYGSAYDYGGNDYGGYDGYGGYGGYDEGATGGDFESLDPEQLAGKLEAWKVLVGELSARAEPVNDEHGSLEFQLRELRDQAQEAATAAELGLLEPTRDALQFQELTWAESYAELRAFMPDLEELTTWNGFAESALEFGEFAPGEEELESVYKQIVEVYNPVFSLPLYERQSLTLEIAAIIEQRAEEIVAMDTWVAALQGLLDSRGELAPAEVAGRARVLLRSGPTSPELLALLGLAQVELGRGQQALPNLHLALSGQADFLLEGEAQSALAKLAIEATQLVSAAQLSLDNNEPTAALALAERSTELAPMSVDAYQVLAECLLALGDGERALKVYRTATLLEPSATTVAKSHIQLALQRRQLSEALGVADLLLNEDPRDPVNLRLRSRILRQIGRAGEAGRDLAFAKQIEQDSSMDFSHDWLNLGGQASKFLVQADGAPKADQTRAMPWTPRDAQGQLLGAQVSELLVQAFRGEIALEDLLTPPADLSLEDLGQWPHFARYMAGEIALWRNGKEASKPWFQSVIRELSSDYRLAWLASSRLEVPLHHGRFSTHLDLQVPRDYATLDEALEQAKRGQTIVLAEGEYSLHGQLDKSVRIQGSGSGITIVNLVPGGGGIQRNFLAQPKLPGSIQNERNGDSGWIEFEDLKLYQTYKGKDGAALPEGEEQRLSVACGTVSLVRCELSRGTGIVVEPGGRLLVSDCDFTDAYRAPIIVRGGRVRLDRVVIAMPLEVAGGGLLLADRLTLAGQGALSANGPGAKVEVKSLMASKLQWAALVATSGAHIEVGHVLWGAVDGQVLGIADRGSRIHVNELVQFGRSSGELGANVTIGTTDLRFQSDAPLVAVEAPELAGDDLDTPPLSKRVHNTNQLSNALEDGIQLIELEPGSYIVSAYKIHADTRLVGVGEGVKIMVQVDDRDRIFVVPKGLNLSLTNIELGLETSRPAEPGSALARAGGGELLDRSHDIFRYLVVEGSVLLDNVTQSYHSSTGSGVGEYLADVRMGGSLVSFGLQKGKGIEVQMGGEAWLINGGVKVAQVFDGGLHLAGRGNLERLEVTGPMSRVSLDDLRSERLKFAAFRQGAPDPRSALRRRLDGQDPVEFQTELMAAARKKYIYSMHPDQSLQERGSSIALYLAKYDQALRLTEELEETRHDLAFQQVASILRGDIALIREARDQCYRSWGGYAMASSILRNIEPDDHSRLIGENRAAFELGAGATAQELAVFSDWEEAVLNGKATQKEMALGKQKGMTPREYRAELRRQEARRLRLEAEATAAIASGDAGEIKRCLMAISLSRWLAFVLEDEEASLYEVENAIASAGSSIHQAGLVAKRNELAEALYTPSGGGGLDPWRFFNGGMGSPRGSSSSSYSSGGSGSSPGFDSWLQSAEQWNRDMDRALDAVKSSSYDSYRNSYNY